PTQGIALFDFSFGAGGILTARSYDVTSLRDIFDVARSQHETFTHEAADVRGALDRILTNAPTPGDYADFDSEESSATCTLSTVCSGAPNADPALALCQAGFGVGVVPRPYGFVPGAPGPDDTSRGMPWFPAPAYYVLLIPVARDIVRY